MKDNSEKRLKYAIQNSKNIFLINGYTDEESLDNWLGQSLYYFYKDNTVTGFSRESVCVLKDINKNEILNFLVNNYIEKINNTEDLNIRDDFQAILKNKINSNGIENVKIALKNYIALEDINGFDSKDAESILKYKPDSLLQSMGIITIKKVLQEDNIVLDEAVDDINYNCFFASDFAVLSNKNHDIEKIVSLMEGIRSGKII